ncbi:MAG: DNA recombination/repair protein RecA, partial [Candidatus Neomarinimicrobiota bacterium]
MADDKDKKAKAIDLAISQVDRQYGKGSLMRLGDERPT